MANMVQIIIGFFALIVLFLPAALLIYATIKVSKIINGLSPKLLALGAILLTISSLDILFTYFVAYAFDAKLLANYAIYTNYVFRIVNLLAMVSIGIGLVRFANEINSKRRLSDEPSSI